MTSFAEDGNPWADKTATAEDGTAPGATAADTIEFSAADYSVAQSAGRVTISVDRSGDASRYASVGYRTHHATALYDVDYTGTEGTLYWGPGETGAKSFNVAIFDARPLAASRDFTVNLFDAVDATAGSRSTATVTIMPAKAVITPPPVGTPPVVKPPVATPPVVTPPVVTPPVTSGTGGPDAPGSLVMTSQSVNGVSLSWSVAAETTYPVSYYKIYRNGAAYATSTATRYSDAKATNAAVSGFNAPATIYGYTVSAVDTQGHEGAQQTQMTYWAYHIGTYEWAGDYSDVTLNYQSTAGAPENGAYDISVTAANLNMSSAGAAYAQPYSGPPAAPEWAADIGAFKYMTIDLKPTVANQKWRLNIVSRLPQGDVYNDAPVTLPGNYGPAPVVGKWATYKIPLNPDLAVGTGTFVGTISGTTLTVTAVNAGMSVQTTAWLTGPGIPADTAINSFGTGSGGVGTYNLSKSASVPAGTTINMQRTNMYKFGLIDDLSLGNNVYYIDNLGFTTE